MKRFFLYIFLPAVILATACKKTAEGYPLERWDEDVVFDPTDSVGSYASQFLMNVYSYLPNSFAGVSSNALLDAGTDDAVYRYPGSTIEIFVNGAWTSWNMPDNVWSKYYTGIRRANIFLKNIGGVPLKTASLKPQWKAEARFLRAMFYFELVKRWGGVPIIGDTVYRLEDNVDLPRNTYDECIQYIANECDSVQDKLLKENTIADGDWGRITRTAALSLKARALLYAASPLNNTTNDLSKWKKAVDASKAIVDLGTHSLYSAYNTMFVTRKTTETILGYQSGTGYGLETNNGPTGYSGTGAGNGLNNPTQNLVDAFPMKNGKAITETGSGYDPQNPYTNRDPRLGYTILYNTTTWLNRAVELYNGGRDYSGTQTGYYMRKFLGAFTTSTAYSATNHNAMIFRYAETLLNYAEALNEYNSAPPEAAFTAVEAIRQRAGLSPYTISRSLNQADFRKLVRNERRLELAFEEHRFWDIRRWKIAPEVLNATVLKGINITKNGTTYSYDYNRNVITTTAWNDRMYLYPIPIAEMEKSKKLVQNPGW
ncbi:MAG: RagB/SusD family nutrient uptake outer membrane protein [Chitinophagaceae bacterium]